MIKILRPLTLALFAAFSLSATAQTISKTDSLAKVNANKKARNVYFEALGPAGVYSFNYDTRFKNRQDGLGGRVGLSYYAQDGDKLFAIPIVVNYLLGKEGKYFEIGAGATFYHFNSESSRKFFGERYSSSFTVSPEGYYYYEPQPTSETSVFGSFNFGYRYQPVNGGFSFRGGFSPIFSSHEFIPYWPYLSFGYSF
ncbi:hypothetical protein [Mucilaginibacter pedocola]|uniref:Outer membrane protein beta-barrel domain-containing protein n=1 Tax=Mucilaginibacter pedocola TaxID=1792845 RepID=A0A1S9PEE0_9SPHI|nr:hypothetical protein [Mucilaginibacter pedocola]OOQ59300.1 hypothetical protein BC343_28695 [Mucilaginibacter pedocola]